MGIRLVIETRDSTADPIQDAVRLAGRIIRGLGIEKESLIFRRGKVEVDFTRMKTEKEVYDAFIKEREKLFKEANGIP